MKKMIKFYKIRIPLILISILVILYGAWLYTGKNFVGEKDLGIFTPKGFNFGVEFQGGLVHQITVYSGISIEEMRSFTKESGLGNDVQQILIDKNKQIGNEASFLIRTILSNSDQKAIESEPGMTPAKYFSQRVDKLYSLIKEKHGEKYEITGANLEKANRLYPDAMTGEILEERTATKRVVENVVKESENVISPVYSKGLRVQALGLIAFVLIIMLLYIAVRFKLKYAVGAIAALIHDAFVMLGFISFTQLSFDYTIVAAILFILGYSINDTIVIFDRIRENFIIIKDATEREIINRSINQTLARTIVTSFTTFLAIFALFLWGGDKIYGFSASVIVGLLSGTYSSIIIASPIVEWWDSFFNKENKIKKTVINKDEQLKSEDKKLGNQKQKENFSALENRDEKIVLSKKQMKKLGSSKKKR